MKSLIFYSFLQNCIQEQNYYKRSYETKQVMDISTFTNLKFVHLVLPVKTKKANKTYFETICFVM